MINLIWAQTKSGIIANNNQLPWKIKDEMNYFRKTTLNKTVVMGSKTFDSMNGPLKNRQNIILTNHSDKYKNNTYTNCFFTNDITSLIDKYAHNKDNDLWIIGGANVYKEFLPFADFLYVSIIKENYPGDLKFPDVKWDDFEQISKTDFNEFEALVYKRK